MLRKIVFDPGRPWLGGNIFGGDENTYCPPVWDYLIDTFKPSTICDVGCGEGHLMLYFFKKGISVAGIEGLEENKFYAPAAIRNTIIIHDFQNRFDQVKKCDMVLSCEFVEHVEEKYSINYLDQFKECGILVFTHAVPDQIGRHHVNCKDDAYWISVMEVFKFTWLKEETNQARHLSAGNLWNTTLIFKNSQYENLGLHTNL